MWSRLAKQSKELVALLFILLTALFVGLVGVALYTDATTKKAISESERKQCGQLSVVVTYINKIGIRQTGDPVRDEASRKYIEELNKLYYQYHCDKAKNKPGR